MCGLDVRMRGLDATGKLDVVSDGNVDDLLLVLGRTVEAVLQYLGWEG